MDDLLISNFNNQLKVIKRHTTEKGDTRQQNKEKPVFKNVSRKFRYESDDTASNSKDDTDKIRPVTPPAPPPPILMPPPPSLSKLPQIDTEEQAYASMLMSWYMAGYHTGYCEAIKKTSK